MTVEKDIVRKAVVITWDTEIVLGDMAEIRTLNVTTGGKGSAGTQRNDGEFPLTFPQDYNGECAVEVEGSEGGVDTGTFTVGNYVPLEPGEPGAPPVVDPEFGIDEETGVPEVNPLA